MSGEAQFVLVVLTARALKFMRKALTAGSIVCRITSIWDDNERLLVFSLIRKQWPVVLSLPLTSAGKTLTLACVFSLF